MSDLIRRKDAKDAALTFIVEYCGAAFDEDMQKMLCERLGALPSAEPEWKTGKWIEDGYYGLPCVCSYCGTEGKREWKYCPNCGAGMKPYEEKT